MLSVKNEGVYSASDFDKLNKTIMLSTCLFICVDGELLLEGDIKQKTHRVNDKCSSIINPYLTKYIKENNALPPVAVLITKFDKITRAENDSSANLLEKLEQVVRLSFTPLFSSPSFASEKRVVAIIPVSLGKSIEDEYEDSGELDPINIHLPIFMGSWFALRNMIENHERHADEELKAYDSRIDNYNKEKGKEESKWFLFRSADRISSLQDAITRERESKKKFQSDAFSKIETLKNYRKMFSEELSGMDHIYINGEARSAQEFFLG